MYSMWLPEHPHTTMQRVDELDDRLDEFDERMDNFEAQMAIDEHMMCNDFCCQDEELI